MAEKKYDFSHTSDDELDSIIKEETAKASPPKQKYDFSHTSDAELDDIIKQELEGPSIGDRALGAASAVGKFVDSVTGAPTRAALSELTRTTPEFGKDKPSILGNISAAGSAFAHQFGEDPDLAPTNKETWAKNFGLSTAPLKDNIPVYKFSNEMSRDELAKLQASGVKPDVAGRYEVGRTEGFSPAGMAGLATDLVADPLNALPIGSVLKGGGKALEFGAELLGKGVSKIPGVKATVKTTAELLNDYLKPTVAKDLGKLQETAATYGIDLTKAPEAIEFGKDSTISRASRSQAEQGGQARLEKHREFLGEVSQAFDKSVEEISHGAPLSRADAGVHLKDSYDRSVAALFDKADVRYSTITHDYPALRLSNEAVGGLTSKINGVEKYAKGLVSRGIRDQKAMGQELLDVTSALRRNEMSFKQINEFRDALGRKAFQTGNTLGQMPSDISKMRDLYGALTDALQETVRTEIQGGESLAGALKIDNQLISDFMTQKKQIADILGNARLAPEQVFDRLTKNSSQIKALKEILSPEDFAKLKGAYLEGLIKRDEFNNIPFAQLKTALKNRQNIEVVKQLFEPAEAKAILDIAELGERAGTATLTPSGPSNFFKDMIRGTRNHLESEWIINGMKSSARKRALALPKDVSPKEAALFGPKAISKKEALGLRLPQQISIQQRNKERGK